MRKNTLKGETFALNKSDAPKIKLQSSETLKKITISAVLLGLALATKLLTSFSIPILGANGIKVGFGGIFTAFPAILFGPVYGGVVSALSDFLGAMIKPEGAYIPWLTLTAFCGGFIKGAIWQWIKKATAKRLRVAFCVLFGLIFLFGISTHICVMADGVSDSLFPSAENVEGREEVTAKSDAGELTFPTKTAFLLTKYSSDKSFTKNFAKYIMFLSLGMELFGLLGAAMTFLDCIISRKKDKIEDGSYLRILCATLTSGMLVTTVNTQILLMFLEVYKGRAFWILWIPRAVEEILVVMIQSYFIAVLYAVYKRRIERKAKTV